MINETQVRFLLNFDLGLGIALGGNHDIRILLLNSNLGLHSVFISPARDDFRCLLPAKTRALTAAISSSSSSTVETLSLRRVYRPAAPVGAAGDGAGGLPVAIIGYRIRCCTTPPLPPPPTPQTEARLGCRARVGGGCCPCCGGLHSFGIDSGPRLFGAGTQRLPDLAAVGPPAPPRLVLPPPVTEDGEVASGGQGDVAVSPSGEGWPPPPPPMEDAE